MPNFHHFETKYIVFKFTFLCPNYKKLITYENNHFKINTYTTNKQKATKFSALEIWQAKYTVQSMSCVLPNLKLSFAISLTVKYQLHLTATPSLLESFQEFTTSMKKERTIRRWQVLEISKLEKKTEKCCTLYIGWIFRPCANTRKRSKIFHRNRLWPLENGYQHQRPGDPPLFDRRKRGQKIPQVIFSFRHKNIRKNTELVNSISSRPYPLW